MSNHAKVRAGKARAKQFTSETQRRAALHLVEKRGPDYMREIGRKGARTFYRRYQWSPVGTSGWAIRRRDTGEIVKIIGVLPFARE